MEGYAIYFCLIEMLREQINYMLPVESIQDIAYELHTSEDKIKAVIFNSELFEMHENSFFSARLLRSMESYNTLKNKQIEAGRKGGLSRAKASLERPSSIKGKEIKGNKRKLNKSKVKEIKENKESEILVFPFNSDLFLQVWEVLKKEKKWKGKSFAALQASLEQLGQYPEDEAIQMMKNTIAGGWQGLFEIKKNNTNTNTIVNGQQQPISKAQQILEGTEWVRKKLAERRAKQSGGSDSYGESTSGN